MRHQTQVETLQTLLKLRESNHDQSMLGQIVQIPTHNYTAPEILAREINRVFRNYPMVAGHISSLRQPGDYIMSIWRNLPYVVVRDKAG